MNNVAEELRAKGHTPYVIPGGGANAVGTLGYVNAAREILAQARHDGLRIDYVVHATGTGPTQAGLIIGFHVLNSKVKVLGLSNGPDEATGKQRVQHLIDDTINLLGLKLCRLLDAALAVCPWPRRDHCSIPGPSPWNSRHGIQ